jgi:GMP synthase (glutamine-hydrolysing)
VQRAVGDQLTCVFVDHGLLREGEPEQVEQEFVAATGVRLVVVDARERFLDALAGVSDPETKRKDHRPGVHPGLRAGRPRRRGPRRG